MIINSYQDRGIAENPYRVSTIYCLFMRKSILNYAVAAIMGLSSFCQTAHAQLTAQIGTGTQAPLTNNSIYSPICRFNATSTNDCSRSNLLYTATELTNAGITTGATINKIAFYKIGTGASTGGFTFEIRMRNSTTVAPLSNTTTWTSITSTHTQVYATTAQTVPATAGWVEFTLNTPFTYTGQSLEIAMSHDMTGISGSPSTGGFDWQYTNGFQDYVIGTVGTSLSSIGTLSGTVTNYKVRPNIRFDYTTGTTPAVTLTGTSSLCTGATTTLTGTPSGGTYSSANTAVATVNPTTGLVTAVAAGTSVITYTSGSNTATLTMTVNGLPATPAAITGTTNLCTGATTTLSSSTSGGSWTSSNTSVATVNSSGVVSGSSAGTATITYTVNNAANCTASVNTTVTVNATPAVAAITGANSLCAGSATTLSSTTPGGAWSSSNTTVATVNSSGVVSGLSAGTATITYSVSNAANCTASVSTTVTVSAAPTVAAIAGATSLCAGSATTLSNTTPGGTWSSSNAGIATIDANGTVVGVAAGNAVITYTVSSSGCSSSVTKSITVNALPVPVITQNGAVLSTTNFAAYSWSLEGNPIAGANGQTYTATENGAYRVTVTDANGCSGTSAAINVTVGTSVRDVDTKANIQLFPNPASAWVQVRAAQRVDVYVYGIEGRELIRVRDAKEFDISGLADGVYLCKLFDKSGRLLQVQQLVKQAN